MDLDEALTELLGDARPAAAPADDDLIAAARVSMERRLTNSRHGGAVLAELRRRINPATGRRYTWREIEDVTGIPKDTAARWADTPGTTPDQ